MLEVCPPRNEMAAAPVNPRASRLFTTWFDDAAGARGYRVRTAHRPADRRPRGEYGTGNVLTGQLNQRRML